MIVKYQQKLGSVVAVLVPSTEPTGQAFGTNASTLRVGDYANSGCATGCR
jgi:hypothetical protein